MDKKNIVLVFLLCCLAMPLFVSVYQSFKNGKDSELALKILCDEEESEESFPEKDKEEKEKDKGLFFFNYSSHCIFTYLFTYQFALEAGELLSGISDLPTPPPKFS